MVRWAPIHSLCLVFYLFKRNYPGGLTSSLLKMQKQTGHVAVLNS